MEGLFNIAYSSVKKTIYFISDAHLGNQTVSYKQREKYLISFLHEIGESASHLFILGDLFDFWIEYKHAIRPHYFNILHEFKGLIKNGTKIYYIAGNHDFALGPFLRDTIGIKIYPNDLDITLQGKRIYLCHGDIFIKPDIGYRLWRAMLRNPFNQALYKWLHPNIGVPIANFLSTSSRCFKSKKYKTKIKKQYIQQVQRFFNNGFEIVMLGHTHYPQLYNFNGNIYCNTGEWLKRYTFAKLENGDVTLWEYIPGKSYSQIEPKT